MKKLIKKIKHVSHIDLDGYGCTLLTEFIVESYPEGMFELDASNILPNQLIGTIKKILNEISTYQMVIITDLAISQEVVDLIDNSGHSDKFVVIDHHQTKVDTSKYPWLNIHINKYDDAGNETDIQTCATELYFNFLQNDFIFDINLLHLPSMESIKFFIDAVVAWDTRSFNKNPDALNDYDAAVCFTAPRLNILFHALDKDGFKEYIKSFITNDNFGKKKVQIGAVGEYTEGPNGELVSRITDTTPNKTEELSDEEKAKKILYFYKDIAINENYLMLTRSTDAYPWIDKIIEIEERRNKKYIESALKKVNIISLNKDVFKNGVIHSMNYTVGLVFAERNASDISEAINKAYPEIDFCAVVTNNQVGFYTIKDDINVGLLAEVLGGGGHQKAAGFTIEYADSNWFNKNHFIAMFNNAANIAIPTR